MNEVEELIKILREQIEYERRRNAELVEENNGLKERVWQLLSRSSRDADLLSKLYMELAEKSGKK